MLAVVTLIEEQAKRIKRLYDKMPLRRVEKFGHWAVVPHTAVAPATSGSLMAAATALHDAYIAARAEDARAKVMQLEWCLAEAQWSAATTAGRGG